LLGDFNVKLGREVISKPTNGNESLPQSSNDNEVRVVNYATSEILYSKVPCFHITTFINTHNQVYNFLIDKGLHSNVVDVRADCDNVHYLVVREVRGETDCQ
jgi:hypothetical protein